MSKNDHTREWIAAGYLELAEETPLRKITVQKLCSHVRINRSTFYYHFSSIQDLIQWIYHKEVNEPVQQAIVDNLDFQTEISKNVLTSIYKRREFWQRALRLPTEQELIDFMLRDTMENWKLLIQAILQFKGIRPEDLTAQQVQELKYIQEYYCYAHHHISITWMRDGMVFPPEMLAKIIDNIALNGFTYAVDKAVE